MIEWLLCWDPEECMKVYVGAFVELSDPTSKTRESISFVRQDWFEIGRISWGPSIGLDLRQCCCPPSSRIRDIQYRVGF